MWIITGSEVLAKDCRLLKKQAFTWPNDSVFSIGQLRTLSFSKILIQLKKFSFRELRFKML